MEFRTELKIDRKIIEIKTCDKILTLGSCFSDVLGNFLQNHKIDTLVNPFQTVYNLKSIANLLIANLNDFQNSARIIEREEHFYHFDFHSSFNAESEIVLLKKIETSIYLTQSFLNNSDFLILTLGTSWVYEHQTGVVSNCHKQNKNQFIKRILEPEEQIEIFEKLYAHLKIQNPKLKIILTVSPVRHSKDGLENNNYSKSILRMVCEKIKNSKTDVFYFPSFEIMMDDLRDYRFYKSDLIHPTEMAEKYIIDKFTKTYFNAELLEFITIWDKIKSKLNHHPFNPSSVSHQIFLRKLKNEINNLNYDLNFEAELSQIESQITEL